MPSPALPTPWCPVPHPRVPPPRVTLAVKPSKKWVTRRQASVPMRPEQWGHQGPPPHLLWPPACWSSLREPALRPHLTVPDVNQTLTHTAVQLQCPQHVLCLGFTGGTGHLSTPIQSRLVRLMPLCQLLHLSGELGASPPYLAPTPGSVPPCSRQAGRTRVHVIRKEEAGLQLSPGAGRALGPASYMHTHPCSIHTHMLTAHLLRAQYHTECPLTRKSSIRRAPRQQQQEPTATGSARPQSTGAPLQAWGPWPKQGAGLAHRVTGSYDTLMAGWLGDLGWGSALPSGPQFPHLFGEKSCAHVSLPYPPIPKPSVNCPLGHPPRTQRVPGPPLPPGVSLLSSAPVLCLGLSGRR